MHSISAQGMNSESREIEEDRQSSERVRFIEAALRIGQGLVRRAVWNGESCSWQTAPGEVLSRRSLYNGTPGIALFLAELYGLSSDCDVRHVAEGAIRHAFEHRSEASRESIGLYIGQVGAAYAAARVGQLIDSPACINVARDAVEAIHWVPTARYAPDVMDGVSGSIPGLLCLASMLESDHAYRLAGAIGDYLIDVARREPRGWSWDRSNPAAIRNLTGFSHGASGVGYGLLELFVATRESRYAYGAEQAFRYEREFFDPSANNWLDLRHDDLMSYLYGGRTQALVSLLSSGSSILPYVPSFGVAWCSGAPGIALARVRAATVLQNDSYLVEAEAAIQSTIASIDRLENYSLCHGVAGNCDVLLEAAASLHKPALREIAIAHALRGLENIETVGKSWPCGTRDGTSNPGLMLGEAGIGYFYLRAANDTIPSPLFLKAPGRLTSGSKNSYPQCYPSSFDEAYVKKYFAKTMAIFGKLGRRGLLHNPKHGHTLWRLSAPLELFAAIIGHIEKERDLYLRSLLVDAFSVERAKFELTIGIRDFTEEYITAVRRRLQREQWQTVNLRVATTTRMIVTAYDWDEWLLRGVDSCDAPMRGPEEIVHVLYRQDQGIHEAPMHPLLTAVVHVLASPRNLKEIVLMTTEAMSEKDCDVVSGSVENCVEYALFEGILDAAELRVA